MLTRQGKIVPPPRFLMFWSYFVEKCNINFVKSFLELVLQLAKDDSVKKLAHLGQIYSSWFFFSDFLPFLILTINRENINLCRLFCFYWLNVTTPLSNQFLVIFIDIRSNKKKKTRGIYVFFYMHQTLINARSSPCLNNNKCIIITITNSFSFSE
jgi:hypothetical protein